MNCGSETLDSILGAFAGLGFGITFVALWAVWILILRPSVVDWLRKGKR